MGSEFAQNDEWSEARSLDWHLTQWDEHRGVQRAVAAINHTYQQLPALWQQDTDPKGFEWIVGDDGAGNTMAFTRWSSDGVPLVALCNFAPVPHENYQINLPIAGEWAEVLNTDDLAYGGSDYKNGKIVANPTGATSVKLAPLATIWLAPASSR
jgi:1,4-alpha-glucan branching enzyme